MFPSSNPSRVAMSSHLCDILEYSLSCFTSLCSCRHHFN
jgi:hypothetical protein